MRMVVLVLLVLLAYIERSQAAESQWVEVTGHAAISGAEDRDAARRRALADALFNAALMGGADVRGHTAVSKSVVTADLTIVRAIGRVLDHAILSQKERQGLWEVTIKARVGLGGDPFCQSPHRLPITVYAPIIDVSPHAPAWSEELGRTIAVDLIEQLDRHRATDIVRVTDRRPPAVGANEALDYTVLTKGSVRMAPGEFGFVPVLRIDAGRTALGDTVLLEAEFQLHSPDGGVYRQVFASSAEMVNSRLLGRLGELTRRDRVSMAKALTKGLRETFDALLDVKSCEPLISRLGVQGGKLTVPIGSRHGLSRAALAFTADRNTTTELLEIVEIGPNHATLRPLDPASTPKSMSGRTVRFVEAAW